MKNEVDKINDYIKEWCEKMKIEQTKEIEMAFKAGQKWNRDNFYTLEQIKEIIN